MQLLVGKTKHETTAPYTILCSKYTLVILLILNIIVNIKSVTAELTCHQCRGINCLRTSYQATQKCLNDLDICANVFDGQTILAQGCWEQLSEDLRNKCTSDAQIRQSTELRECFKCNENLCNNLAAITFECIECDSDGDDNCRSNPQSLVPSRCGISRTPNQYCFVKQEGKRVTRGCSNTLEEQIACLSSENCAICQPDELRGCNNIVVATDESDSGNDNTGNGESGNDSVERICHQCIGINCLRSSYKATQKCTNDLDICVSIFDKQTILAQGCWEKLPEEIRSKCDNEAQCLKCNDNLCNSLASSSFECIQCDSDNDDNCRTNPKSLIPSRCNITRTFNEYCLVKQEGKRVIRVCSNSLEEQRTCLSSDSCMICQPSEVSGCNDIEVALDDNGSGNGDGSGESGSDHDSNGGNAGHDVSGSGGGTDNGNNGSDGGNTGDGGPAGGGGSGNDGSGSGSDGGESNGDSGDGGSGSENGGSGGGSNSSGNAFKSSQKCIFFTSITVLFFCKQINI